MILKEPVGGGPTKLPRAGIGLLVLLLYSGALHVGATITEGSVLWNDIGFNFPDSVVSSWNTSSVSSQQEDPCSFGWQHVACSGPNVVGLNLQGLGIATTLVPAISKLTFLESLNIGYNNFSGAIPSTLGDLTRLTSLNLSNNIFSGAIPTTLANLNLTFMSLAYNNLTGTIPSALLSFCPSGAFDGNPGLTTVCPIPSPPPPPPPPSPPVSSPSSPSVGSSNTGAIVGGVVGGIVGCLLLAGALFWWWIYKRRSNMKRRVDLEGFELLTSGRATSFLARLNSFTLQELKTATKDFDPSTRLGEGGYSVVYQGWLADGKPVAVKKLKEGARRRGDEQFLGELDLISRTVHSSLLRLEGFCMEGSERLLVFPLMPMGSVAAHLKGGHMPPIPWELRIPLALGAAEGLAYMHGDCIPPVLHGDVKADNILLDSNYKAMVADFGLARHMGEEEARQTSALRGTLGYIAPEYPITGQVSTKSDVYAYGVFLVELALGRSFADIVEDLSATTCTIYEWVTVLLLENRVQGSVHVPATLPLGPGDLEQVETLLQVAALCMFDQPEERITMQECTTLLHGEGLAERWEAWQQRFSSLVDVHSDTMSVYSSLQGTGGVSGGTGSLSSNYGVSGPMELSGPR